MELPKTELLRSQVRHLVAQWQCGDPVSQCSWQIWNKSTTWPFEVPFKAPNRLKKDQLVLVTEAMTRGLRNVPSLDSSDERRVQQ